MEAGQEYFCGGGRRTEDSVTLAEYGNQFGTERAGNAG